MSATNRGATRSPADYYPTPAWCVHRLLEAFPAPLASKSLWFDPCAGDGAIIRAVNEARPGSPHPTWLACEIRPECAPALRSAGVRGDVTGDFLALPSKNLARADVILTNPPYSLAVEFIEKCLFDARVPTVAMLLRLNFLGSADRVEFWRRAQVPDVFVLPNRPGFGVNKHGKPGTDACEYAWFVWHSAMKSQVKILATTPKAVRVAQKPKLVKTPDVEDLIA